MHKTIKRIIYAILVLVIISCGISISNNDIYQDGAWFNAQWLGQDIVSLFIAAPVLLLAYYRAFQENRWKWEMVLSGVLFYFAYSYAFYAIVAEFTFLYLLHLPIFGLSVIGLFLVLLHLFQKNIQITSPKRSVKIAVSIFLLLVSAMLSYIWFSDILAHLFA